MVRENLHNLLIGQSSLEKKHSKQWLSESLLKLTERVTKGAYDPLWLDLYLENAKKKGIKEIGIVDHLYRFTDCRKYFEKNIWLDESRIGTIQKQWLDLVMTESMDHFVETISNSKENGKSMAYN